MMASALLSAAAVVLPDSRPASDRMVALAIAQILTSLVVILQALNIAEIKNMIMTFARKVHMDGKVVVSFGAQGDQPSTEQT